MQQPEYREGPGRRASAALAAIRRARSLPVRAAWLVAVTVLLAAFALLNLRHVLAGAAFTPYAAGNLAALLAVGLLLVQFALSSRIRALDRAFALNRLLSLHAKVGPVAGVLALLHPVLIFMPAAPTGADIMQLWREGLGALALVIAGTVVATSLWRTFLELSFEAWRLIHQLVFIMVALIAVHSLVLGSDIWEGWPRAFWWGIIAVFAGLTAYEKVYKPTALRRALYTVDAVTKASRDTWNLDLRALNGTALEHVPGQFAFLTLLPDQGGKALRHLPARLWRAARLALYGKAGRAEEHPFTISSAGDDPGVISFTIKESGDYTSTIGNVRPGTRALVDGPYGQFSHLVLAGGDILMIAGGVGITPMLSMLRHVAARGGPAVTLVWGNKTEEDIILRDEIDGLAASPSGLKVHHVLSEQDDWPGERGFVTEELLGRILSREELQRRVFLCGPPVMMEKVTKDLRRLGVPRSRIHTERFALE